jgi:hypothetical protein
MNSTGGFTLNTQTALTQFQSATNYNVSEFKIPQSSVTIPKVITYDFRVAEYVDKEGNVKKVGLQVAVYEHDNYGYSTLRQTWTDIERVKLDYSTLEV